jgi:hypothetical protein
VVFIHNGILSSHKRSEILSFASKWIELENFILSEVSQAQKAKNPPMRIIDLSSNIIGHGSHTYTEGIEKGKKT